MRLYLAALASRCWPASCTFFRHLNDRERYIVREEVDNYLESYFYIQTNERFIKEFYEAGKELLLDSGAFTAWNLGKEVKLEEYCKFIKENSHIIRKDGGALCAIVLDVIGDADKTYQAQKEMERLGIVPIPCYHIGLGEDERYLDYYVHNYEYISLGGLVEKRTGTIRRILDRLWDKYLLDGAGNPRVKVHGLGITAKDSLERWPWHSVDSSSWMQYAQYGNILLSDSKSLIAVSDLSGSRKVFNQHYISLPHTHQEKVQDYIEDNHFELDRLIRDWCCRAAFNAREFAVVIPNSISNKPHPLSYQLELF